MDPLHRIAERRIEEAIAAGAFDGLAGRGRPLELEDLSGLDPELRASYLVLRGHGYLSEEQALRQELLSLPGLVRAAREDGERARLEDEAARKRLRLALLLEARGFRAEVIERLVPR